MINFKYKFIFCPIQKSGSSLWQQLFLRMNHDPNWFEPPWHKPIPSFKNLNISIIESIMNDPTWTKAIFFREPSLRLLSAYSYLIAKDGDPRLRTKFIGLLNRYNLSPKWKSFVSIVLNVSNIKSFNDLHWRPQTDFCKFHKYYSSFNFIGTFENLRVEGPQLLKKVGVWDQYGANGWSIAGQIKRNILQRNKNDTKTNNYPNITYPKNYNKNDCIFCANNSPHQTNYSLIFKKKLLNSTSTQPLHEIITSKIWSEIHSSSFYQQDYQLFTLLSSLNNKDLYISPRLKSYHQYPFIQN